jgi:hypothetical protein|tara:strand:+ start:37311 stop:38312 length:1002 start_codon:yes stop_codon:yes gene_type:complete
MFEYFYHEILRKTVISFGTLFNDIDIKKTDASDNVTSVVKVPLAYGPMQKFLARLEQSPDLNKATQITLPRMSFEMTGISYDSSRKVTTTQTFLSGTKDDGSDIRKNYMPVPYNVDFELSIYTKINDEMLQIVEQILPYFQPQYTMTVNLLETIGERRDVPIILNSISMDDQYEGNFETRRSLIYTLRFTAKTYIFGPISTGATTDIIKKSVIGFGAGGSGSRQIDVRYTAEPVATKSYSENNTTSLLKDLLKTETVLEVISSSGIVAGDKLSIGEETVYVSDVNGNKLRVTRGFYSTSVIDHVGGTGVKLISEADNAKIEIGDDFGFDGEWS